MNTADNRRFPVRGWIARRVLKLAGWTVSGEVPSRGILVGAPHTSNWDWVLTILLSWVYGIRIRLLVKKELFKGPIGWLLRSTGAVALDRDNPARTINELLAEADADDEAPWLLGIAAEGTRSRGEYWKSGFYRLAQQTGMSITLAWMDAPNRKMGWGPTWHVSGDVKADMDWLRDYYKDSVGIKPENFTPPRLREEPGPAEG